MQRDDSRKYRAATGLAVAMAVFLSFSSPAHADGYVSIQVSGTDRVLATVRVALFDAAGVDVAPTACTTTVRPELLTLDCVGLADGAYRATVVAPSSGIAVSGFCSPADPSLEPEPDGTIRLRPGAEVFICTTLVEAVEQASNPSSGGLLPALGASPVLAGLALLFIGVGSALSRAARRPVR